MPTPKIIHDFLNLPDGNNLAEFLKKYSEQEQTGLVACMYIGREHIHAKEIIQPSNLSAYTLDTSFIEHIPPNEYAGILHSKFSAAKTYLEKLIECAENSNFDLQTIFSQ